MKSTFAARFTLMHAGTSLPKGGYLSLLMEVEAQFFCPGGSGTGRGLLLAQNSSLFTSTYARGGENKGVGEGDLGDT